MSLHVFNATLLIGWLLVLIGGVLLNVGAGLVIGGLLLIVLAFAGMRVAGGVFMTRKDED